ncbi:MAG: response regulator [Clostridiales bacterium]|nr:response regulator [Clostridiales bacterium]
MEAARETIFLVDDDITNLTIGDQALADYYNVFTVNSGSTLLRLLERRIPDMILLDVEMPGMNGYETIKRIKSNPATSGIPVIFLTAQSASEDELEGLSLGAIDYILKPFSPVLLRKRIEMHLLVESQRHALIQFNTNLMDMVEEKTKTVVELRNAVLYTMAGLVEYRDVTTGKHIERTQAYLQILLNAIIASGLYFNEVASWDLDLVLQSAQLHDVGKISIKDDILLKPGKLTPEEFETIKGHTTNGKNIIDEIKTMTTEQAFLDYARVFAGSHHEKWDGSGYPEGLAGEDIPLLGRVLAIVDVYDALISDRPYKQAIPHEEAVQIILDGCGTQFDPQVIGVFKQITDLFSEITSRNGWSGV